MDTATQILVIITSSVLVIFLILAITLTIMMIKMVKRAKVVMAKAENVVDSAETIAASFAKVKGPIGLVKLLNNLMSMFKDTRRK